MKKLLLTSIAIIFLLFSCGNDDLSDNAKDVNAGDIVNHDQNAYDFMTIRQIDYEIIALRDFANFVIKSDNTLWAWGSNHSGGLADGTKIDRIEPVKIMDNAVSVAAAWHRTFVIRTDGSLWAWSINSDDRPMKIMDDVISATVMGFASFAVKIDGSLWAWGENRRGVLGDGTVTDRAVPVKIMSDVNSVVSGNAHTLALKNDGSVWAWGANDYGEIGDGTVTTYEEWDIKENHDKTEPVKIIENIKHIAAGSSTSFAIDKDGSLWVWGNNRDGRLGDGTATDKAIPTKTMDNIISVATGEEHTLVVKADNTLWAWGNNNAGELGNGTTTRSDVPIKIMNDVQIVKAGDFPLSGEIRINAGRSLAVKTDGSLWAWGYNLVGELGADVFVSTPVKIMENVMIP